MLDDEYPKLFDCPDFLRGKYCHALCNYKHQTEEEKNAIDKFRHSLDLNINARPSKKLGPVYIIAGPERSGTSWLFNAVRLLLIHERSPFGPADSYRLNHITKNDLITRLFEASGRPLVVRTMRIPDSNWDEDLDREGHGYLVFVSHRDLRDVIDDSLSIGWMKHDMSLISNRLKAYMTAFEYWRLKSTGDFRYEATRHDPVEQIKHLARLMGIDSEHAEHIACQINSLRPGRAIGPDQVTKMWPEQRVVEASHDEEDSGNSESHLVVVKGQPKLSDSERMKIRNAHSDFHDRYGYV